MRTKYIVTAAMLCLLLLTSCDKTVHRQMKTETVAQFSATPGEMPFICACADGMYYWFSGAFTDHYYRFSASDSMDTTRFIYRPADHSSVALMNLEANERFVVWGEGKDGEAEIMAYDREQDLVRPVYSLPKAAEDGDVRRMQYPLVALKEDRTYFIERHQNERRSSLVECNLKDGTSRELFRFDEYSLYRPAIHISGNTLYTIAGMEEDRILLLQYDLAEDSYTLTRLPAEIDLVFEIACDTKNERLLLYYRSTEDGEEHLAFFAGEEEHLSEPFYTVPSNGWIQRDEVRIVGDTLYFCVCQPADGYHWEDGFCLIAYNMRDGQSSMVEKTFDVFPDGEDVYCLSFRHETVDGRDVWTRMIQKIIF